MRSDPKLRSPANGQRACQTAVSFGTPDARGCTALPIKWEKHGGGAKRSRWGARRSGGEAAEGRSWGDPACGGQSPASGANGYAGTPTNVTAIAQRAGAPPWCVNPTSIAEELRGRGAPHRGLRHRCVRHTCMFPAHVTGRGEAKRSSPPRRGGRGGFI